MREFLRFSKSERSFIGSDKQIRRDLLSISYQSSSKTIILHYLLENFRIVKSFRFSFSSLKHTSTVYVARCYLMPLEVFLRPIIASELRRLDKFLKMSGVSFTVGRKDGNSAGNVDLSKMCAAYQAIDKHVKVIFRADRTRIKYIL